MIRTAKTVSEYSEMQSLEVMMSQVAALARMIEKKEQENVRSLTERVKVFIDSVKAEGAGSMIVADVTFENSDTVYRYSFVWTGSRWASSGLCRYMGSTRTTTMLSSSMLLSWLLGGDKVVDLFTVELKAWQNDAES